VLVCCTTVLSLCMCAAVCMQAARKLCPREVVCVHAVQPCLHVPCFLLARTVPPLNFPLLPAASPAQVPGCHANLNAAGVSTYFRRHRVCLTHAKADQVVISGIAMRCAQKPALL
jgi:hypothetical protein